MPFNLVVIVRCFSSVLYLSFHKIKRKSFLLVLTLLHFLFQNLVFCVNWNWVNSDVHFFPRSEIFHIFIPMPSFKRLLFFFIEKLNSFFFLFQSLLHYSGFWFTHTDTHARNKYKREIKKMEKCVHFFLFCRFSS